MVRDVQRTKAGWRDSEQVYGCLKLGGQIRARVSKERRLTREGCDSQPCKWLREQHPLSSRRGPRWGHSWCVLATARRPAWLEKREQVKVGIDREADHEHSHRPR